ncbi:MAG: general secretion pathway protein GspK [Deltaproteobacteria bacterium]|nr:general secretion pathway protein GspK [Deltaproteobacteria bacterium]
MIVITTITLVGSAVAELQFNTRVDLQLAINARDTVQAEYAALSAMRVRALLLKNGRLLEQGMQKVAQSMGIESSLIPPLGSLLTIVPINCSLLSAITKSIEDNNIDQAKDDEENQFFNSVECISTCNSEHGKISLPAMALSHPSNAVSAQQQLLGLLSDPKLEHYFQEDSQRGNHAESPAELINAIIDWIDTDKVQTGTQVGDEDRYYSYLRDPYRTKNAPFDSVAELMLVHGINDELYDILKKRVTIYKTSSQIEIGTADDITLAIGICSALTEPGYCSTLLGTPVFWTALNEMRGQNSSGLITLNVTILKTILDSIGVPYDEKILGQTFTDRASTTWYSIEAEGINGNARSIMRSIYQTQEDQYYYFHVE